MLSISRKLKRSSRNPGTSSSSQRDNADSAASANPTKPMISPIRLPHLESREPCPRSLSFIAEHRRERDIDRPSITPPYPIVSLDRLCEVHHLILHELASNHPVTLISVNRHWYDTLTPVIYKNIRIDQFNVHSVLDGLRSCDKTDRKWRSLQHIREIHLSDIESLLVLHDAIRQAKAQAHKAVSSKEVLLPQVKHVHYDQQFLLEIISQVARHKTYHQGMGDHRIKALLQLFSLDSICVDVGMILETTRHEISIKVTSWLQRTLTTSSSGTETITTYMVTPLNSLDPPPLQLPVRHEGGTYHVHGRWTAPPGYAELSTEEAVKTFLRCMKKRSAEAHDDTLRPGTGLTKYMIFRHVPCADEFRRWLNHMGYETPFGSSHARGGYEIYTSEDVLEAGAAVCPCEERRWFG
ncbi:hypothetical protein I302_100070 [Kwoniella bestiolae CBS 10118]|uniref:Uncharacterized protein n=1 Tax=Kwoniella bestiolae CBS 10118 TaxID=1296100 RepID=A0A1B9G410_9TREE|nr:hypothetical protein I302_03442 [Kwoniella bestiolae CBS 10118]OCF25769.1 hypothetical protein I302_03442 [Kwoniella bestiolae CBS 10118]